MHYKIFLCVLLFPVSLSAQNGELSLTLEQSASLMNKGSRTLQMADKAVDIARSERQKMNAFWYPSLNASGAYVHLSNHIEVKEPLRQFTDPAKDFVHSIVPDDKFISSILDNIGAHTLTHERARLRVCVHYNGDGLLYPGKVMTYNPMRV